MNTSQLLGLLRRYIKDVGQADLRRVRFTPEHAGRKAEYDGALRALDMLDEQVRKQQQQAQPTLGGEA